MRGTIPLLDFKRVLYHLNTYPHLLKLVCGAGLAPAI